MTIGRPTTRKPRKNLPAQLIGYAFTFFQGRNEVPNVSRMRDVLGQINAKIPQFRGMADDLPEIDDKTLEARVDRFLKQYVASKTTYSTDAGVFTGSQLAQRLGVSVEEFASDLSDKYAVETAGPELEFAWSNPTGRRGRKPFDPNAIDREIESAADLLESLE